MFHWLYECKKKKKNTENMFSKRVCDFYYDDRMTCIIIVLLFTQTLAIAISKLNLGVTIGVACILPISLGSSLLLSIFQIVHM